MKTLLLVAVFGTLALLTWTMPVSGQPLRPAAMQGSPPTEEKIENAVARACATLKKLQREDGSWDEYPGFPGATTSLAVQALALVGEPADSPTMTKAIKALNAYVLDKTYTRSCRAMAYAALVRSCPELRAKLSADAQWLCKTQSGDGMWNYGPVNGAGYDNSNTQFAVIGLRDAAMANIEFSNVVWKRLFTHYTTTQLPDGGWSYAKPPPPLKPDPAKKNATDQPADVPGRAGPEARSQVTVTAPSVASLMIVNDELLKTSGCPCGSNKSSGVASDDRCVDKGIQWLVDYFEGKVKDDRGMGEWTTYFYYGLQRAGQASGLKTFGTHDWYTAGSAIMCGLAQDSCLVLQPRNPTKAVTPPARIDRNAPKPPQVIVVTDAAGDQKEYTVDPKKVVNVALAVIFLVKGNAPVYINKLKYEGDWNRHRRDVYIATEETAKRLERSLRWQVVDIRSDVKTWWDAPILYLSGEENLKLSDDEQKKLKDYCTRGGTLLIEANCANKEFDKQARELLAKLWPNLPLKPLPPDHPLYNCQVPVQQPPGMTGILEGVDDGIRAFVLLTNKDLSCAWQMRDVVKNKPYFDLGINLFMYATDKAPPPPKLSDIDARIQARLKQIQEYEKAVQEEKALALKEKRPARVLPEPWKEARKPADVSIKRVKPGSKGLVTVSLLKHAGNYTLGMHYEVLGLIINDFQAKAGVTLALGGESSASAVAAGTPDVLVIRGDKAMGLTKDDKANLTAYLTGGGFVIAEAIMGRKEFDDDFRAFIKESGQLQLAPLAADDPFLKGVLGKNIQGLEISKPQFTRAAHEDQPGIKTPPVMAIKAGDQIVGYYSPLDLLYSATGYGAYALRGYDKNTALGILVNAFLISTGE